MIVKIYNVLTYRSFALEENPWTADRLHIQLYAQPQRLSGHSGVLYQLPGHNSHLLGLLNLYLFIFFIINFRSLTRFITFWSFSSGPVTVICYHLMIACALQPQFVWFYYTYSGHAFLKHMTHKKKHHSFQFS